MNLLKQSTAATIKLGAFVDDTDGKTAETGLTISQADIRLSKNGGDFAQTNNSAGATHDELGYYNVPLDATDTNTLGRLLVAVSESGALPVWQEFLVVTANVYDTLCSTDSLDVNVTSLADDVITAGKFDESTAYPLKSADTGSTQVARTGADSDTLETLSDEIAAVKAETAAILVDTGTTLDGKLNTIDTNVDSILADTGTDGVKIAGAQTVATVTNLTNLPTIPANWITAAGVATGAIDADAIASNAITSAKIATGAITNAKFASGAIDAAAIATDAIGSAEISAAAVTKIQSGLALEATLTAIKGAGWSTETLAAIDVLIDAIKAKTDNLPASPAAVGSAMTLTAAYDKAKDDVLTPLAVVDSIVDGLKTTLDNIHDTDLPAVKAETALIIEDTGTTLPATLGTLATTAHVQEVEDKVDTADAVADAIKAKTDQLTFTVANKVDATATTDTSSIAVDVWSHATRTLTNQGVEATYPAGGDPLTIYRDTTVTISLTGLGDSTGDAGTKIFFTAKENLEDADSDSILQLVCTRANPITDPDTDDLLYVNKVAPTAATEGTFVFTDHTDGTAVISVAASAAAYLPIYAATPLYWDVKMVTAAGVSTILATGEMYIYGTPTRTVAVT